MSYTKEELDKMWKESCELEKCLVDAYKATHTIPSRCTIITPEIRAVHEEQKRLYGEYLSLMKNTD